MSDVESRVLYGTRLSDCVFQGVDKPFLEFPGDAYLQGREYPGQAFYMEKEGLFSHLMLLGGSGSGKTNVIRQIAAQLVQKSRSDTIRPIFDTKADYIETPGLYRAGDYVLGAGSRFREYSERWNVFDEILVDGSDEEEIEANAREISSVLFKDRGSKTQPFFANAARDILAGTMIYFYRQSREQPSIWRSQLNNRQLFHFIMRNSPAQFARYFSRHADLRGMLTYFGDGGNNQSLGVFAELHSLMYDCFQGAFCTKPDSSHPSFSIRKAVREKKGKNLFIEYDMARGETLIPIYRLLVDLALKEALSGESNGETYLLLDELKLLPRLAHLDDALNYGRSKHVGVTAGLQSVSQLYDVYGQDKARVMLSGFASVFGMRTNDAESREYLSHRFAPNVVAYRYNNGSNQYVDREREGYTVEQWDQMNMEVGQAVIGVPSQREPFLFRFRYVP